jgi:hypothetical protein
MIIRLLLVVIISIGCATASRAQAGNRALPVLDGMWLKDIPQILYCSCLEKIQFKANNEQIKIAFCCLYMGQANPPHCFSVAGERFVPEWQSDCLPAVNKTCLMLASYPPENIMNFTDDEVFNMTFFIRQ